jgi:hypothetical protein
MTHPQDVSQSKLMSINAGTLQRHTRAEGKQIPEFESAKSSECKKSQSQKGGSMLKKASLHPSEI